MIVVIRPFDRTLHALWITEQRKRMPQLPAEDGIDVDGVVLCRNCGCAGNNQCEHECTPDNRSCTLLGDMTCPCCAVESSPLTDERYDYITGQRRLVCIDARPDHVRVQDERATEQTGTERMESNRRGN